MVLPGMKRGMYAVETWDTVKGEPTGEHPALAVAGELRFELPEVPGDIALKVRPIEIAGSGRGAKKRRSGR